MAEKQEKTNFNYVVIKELIMEMHSEENKHGTQAMENVRRIDQIYASDDQVFTFPAGFGIEKKKRGH